MASNVTFRTFLGVFPPERKHVTAMTAPIGSNVGYGFESVWYTMINLILVIFLKDNVNFCFEMIKISDKLTPFDFDMHLVTTFS